MIALAWWTASIFALLFSVYYVKYKNLDKIFNDLAKSTQDAVKGWENSTEMVRKAHDEIVKLQRMLKDLLERK